MSHQPMPPTLEIDRLNKRVIVRQDSAMHVYTCHEEAYRYWPELRPAPETLTDKQERQLSKSQRQSRIEAGRGTVRDRWNDGRWR